MPGAGGGLAIGAGADVHLLDLAAGDVAAAVGGFDVVVQQLIAVVAEVGVVEIADFLRGQHLHRLLGHRHPRHAVHDRAQVARLHRIRRPGADVRRRDRQAGLADVRDGIVELVGVVGRGDVRRGVRAHLHLDAGDVGDVVRVGVDREFMVVVLHRPAFGLGCVHRAGVVRIALRPPDRRPGAVLRRVRLHQQFREIQRVVEGEGRLDVVVLVLVVVAETGVHRRQQEIPGEFGGIGAAGIIVGGIALHRIREHPRVELVAGMGDLLVQRGGGRPVRRVIVQPDLFGGLRVVQRRLQQREIAFEVMPAVFERHRRAFLLTGEIGLRREIHAGRGVERRELAFPDHEGQPPVVPGRVGGRIAGVDPRAVLHVLHVVRGNRETLQVFVDAEAIAVAAASGAVAVLPGRERTGAAARIVAVVGDDVELPRFQRGVGHVLIDGDRAFPAFQPRTVLGHRNAGDLGHRSGRRIDVPHPVRRGGEGIFVHHHLLFVRHLLRDPRSGGGGVAKVGAIRRRGEGVAGGVVGRVRIVLQRAREMIVADHRPLDAELRQRRDEAVGEA